MTSNEVPVIEIKPARVIVVISGAVLRTNPGSLVGVIRPQMEDVFSEMGLTNPIIAFSEVRDSGTVTINGAEVDLAERDLVAVEALAWGRST